MAWNGQKKGQCEEATCEHLPSSLLGGFRANRVGRFLLAGEYHVGCTANGSLPASEDSAATSRCFFPQSCNHFVLAAFSCASDFSRLRCETTHSTPLDPNRTLKRGCGYLPPHPSSRPRPNETSRPLLIPRQRSLIGRGAGEWITEWVVGAVLELDVQEPFLYRFETTSRACLRLPESDARVCSFDRCGVARPSGYPAVCATPALEAPGACERLRALRSESS